MSSHPVANTIATQLGASLCMMGAKDLVGSEKSLRFRIGRGAQRGVTHIEISLNEFDLYDIKLIKYLPRKLESKLIESYSNVYVMDMKYIIGKATGFSMSL